MNVADIVCTKGEMPVEGRTNMPESAEGREIFDSLLAALVSLSTQGTQNPVDQELPSLGLLGGAEDGSPNPDLSSGESPGTNLISLATPLVPGTVIEQPTLLGEGEIRLQVMAGEAIESAGGLLPALTGIQEFADNVRPTAESTQPALPSSGSNVTFPEVTASSTVEGPVLPKQGISSMPYGLVANSPQAATQSLQAEKRPALLQAVSQTGNRPPPVSDSFEVLPDESLGSIVREINANREQRQEPNKTDAEGGASAKVALEGAPRVEVSSKELAAPEAVNLGLDQRATEEDKIPDRISGMTVRVKEVLAHVQKGDGKVSEETGPVSVAQVETPAKESAFPQIKNTGWNPQPVDAGKIWDQVVKKLEVLLTENRSETRIRLEPQSLGELNIKIVMEKGALTAELQATNHYVKNLLEQNFLRLRDSLENHGFQIKGFDVQVGHPDHDDDGQKPNYRFSQVKLGETPVSTLSEEEEYQWLGAGKSLAFGGGKVNCLV